MHQCEFSKFAVYGASVPPFNAYLLQVHLLLQHSAISSLSNAIISAISGEIEMAAAEEYLSIKPVQIDCMHRAIVWDDQHP